MNNFSRVLAIPLRRRLTVAGSLICSLAVAALWVGNLTPILPIVDAVMLDKSIPEWLEEGRVERRQRLHDLTQQMAARTAELERTQDDPQADGGRRAELQHELRELVQDEAYARKHLALYDRSVPLARRYLPSTAFATLGLLMAWLVVGTLVKSAFRAVGNFLSLRLGNLTALELRKEFYRRTLRLDLGTFGQTSSGDLMNRFTADVQAASTATQYVFGLVICEPLRVVGCLLAAAWVSWQLLLITLISAPLAGYAIHWLAKAVKRANRKALDEMSQVYDRLDETFGGLKLVKAFARESRERSRFHQTCRQYYDRSTRIALYNSLVSPTTEVAGIAIVAAAALCGGYLVLARQTHLFGIRISNEPLTHGLMTLFFGMLAGASDPIRRLTSVFSYLQQGAAAADHLYELFDREPQIKDPAKPKQLPRPLGGVEFHGVSFAYKSSEPVLRGIDLKIEPHETIALVGPNGCGKSTLVNLLPRFYDPDAGSITLGGVDLRDVRLRDLRDRIGVVSQEILLFNDTVANNIGYGRPAASEAQIVEAARRAHAHEFIVDKLDDGYQTLVGPAGGRLSGGQRQRIALARAILRDPEILILDEATSQIDVESERLIHQVLAEFARHRTALIITHRPSTLELADRIVVLDQGQIAAVGTFDELAASCPLFRRIAHLEIREAA